MPFLCGFCLIIIVSQFQAQLLPPLACVLLFLIALVAMLCAKQLPFKPLVYLLSGALLGLAYSNGFAYWRLQSVLETQYEQQDIELTVVVNSAAAIGNRYVRTRVDVIEAPQASLRHMQLNWYGDQKPAACETWKINARVKRPHGLRNPGSWSYRQFMLEQNIQAVGYVKTTEFLAKSPRCLADFRARWHQYVADELALEDAAWVIALSTGDKTLISREQYRFMQATGINHLFVISGLHIGLTAMVVYGLVLQLRRFGFGLLIPKDWRPLAAALAMLVAFLYTALADFVIPAQRSLIMIVVFFAGSLVGVHLAVWLRYWLAMALVLLINPLSAMNIGFSLSFAAVALLVITVEHLQKSTPLAHKLRLLIAAQFFIALGLAPLLFFYFQQISWSGPWINLFAIPIVSMLITPLVLLALLLWALRGDDAGLLQWVVYLLNGLFDAINWLHERFTQMLVDVPAIALESSAILLLALIAFFLLTPKNLPAKWFFCIVLIGSLMFLQPKHKVAQGEVFVHVLDVGQGLAVLIRTEQHNLLYDTGAAWDNGSMAEQVIKPVLAYYGIKRLDALIISHFDNDHAGGRFFIEQLMPVARHFASSDEKPYQFCAAGEYFQFDGVRFEFLHPAAFIQSSENDRSCVLLISAAGRQLLLPGDISRPIEAQVVKTLEQSHASSHIDVLVAPHHGSRSSSSFALVEKVAQGIVIFPAGYRNSYGHPHANVINRYQQVGASLWSSAQHGMVTVHIDAGGNVKASSFREDAPRYWDTMAGNHLENY